jgi:GntR family transcriptional regulator
MRELNREGLIQKVPGYGTFVDASPVDLEVDVSLGGFTRDMRNRGMTPSSRIVNVQLISDPSPELVERMGLLSQDEVVQVERLRLVNDVPLALHIACLNHRFCPQLVRYDLAERSLFSLLREEYSLKLDRADEQVYATLASARESELLELIPPAAVLRTERVTYLDTGDVIEFARATYCGEWYRLHISLDALD